MTSKTYTVVAFRYNISNSILYTKTTSNVLAKKVNKALELGADVISIRRVYEDHPNREDQKHEEG